MDEMGNLPSDGSLSRAQTGCQSGDATHHRVVADANNDGASGTWKYIKRKVETKKIFISSFGFASWFSFDESKIGVYLQRH